MELFECGQVIGGVEDVVVSPGVNSVCNYCKKIFNPL